LSSADRLVLNHPIVKKDCINHSGYTQCTYALQNTNSKDCPVAKANIQELHAHGFKTMLEVKAQLEYTALLSNLLRKEASCKLTKPSTQNLK